MVGGLRYGTRQNPSCRSSSAENMTAMKLAEVHRRHSAPSSCDADREVPTPPGGSPLFDWPSLAAQLLGTLTRRRRAAIMADTRLLVQEALNTMDPNRPRGPRLEALRAAHARRRSPGSRLSKAGCREPLLRAIKRLREICRRSSSLEPSDMAGSGRN